MGTNYYFHERSGPRPERLHVGKSSAGWGFLFKAHEVQLYRSDVEELVARPAITSAVDWRRVLAMPGTLVDEYGREILVEEFWCLVQAKRDNPRARHDSRDYQDDEGYRFVRGEFS